MSWGVLYFIVEKTKQVRPAGSGFRLPAQGK